MKRVLLISSIFLPMAMIASKATLAHHNANYPDGVDPAFTGIDLFSYHNDAIAAMEAKRDGTNTENQNITMTGTAAQKSSQTATKSGTITMSNHRNVTGHQE